MRVVAARPTFGPDLARGAVAGLALGLVLAAVLALTDFPEWGAVVWGFALIAGGLLLVSPTGFGLLGGAAAAALALVLGVAHLLGGDSPNPF